MLRDGIFLLIHRVVGVLVPIIMVPLIIRKLGAEEYGIFVFYQSIAVVLSVILLLGADIKGIKDLSQARGVEEVLNRYSVQLSAQLLAAVFFFIVSVVISVTLKNSLYIFLVLLSLKDVFFSTYFHVVISKVYRLTIIDFIIRASMLFLIYFNFLLNAENIIRYSGFLYFSVGLCYATFILRIKVKFSFRLFKVHMIQYKHMYLNRLFSAVKDRFANAYIPLILEFEMLAFYDIVLKFISVGVLPGNVYNQINLKRTKRTFVLPVFLSVVMASLIVMLLCMLSLEFSEYLRLDHLLFKDLIKYVGLGIMALSATSIIGHEGLLKSGLDKYYFISTLATGLTYFIFVSLIGYVFKPTVAIFLCVLICAYLLELVIRIALLSK